MICLLDVFNFKFSSECNSCSYWLFVDHLLSWTKLIIHLSAYKLVWNMHTGLKWNIAVQQKIGLCYYWRWLNIFPCLFLLDLTHFRQFSVGSQTVGSYPIFYSLQVTGFFSTWNRGKRHFLPQIMSLSTQGLNPWLSDKKPDALSRDLQTQGHVHGQNGQLMVLA